MRVIHGSQAILLRLCVRRAALLFLFAAASPARSELAFPLKAKRILFLGDLITHAGQYVAWIEMQSRLQGVAPLPEMITIGLASERAQENPHVVLPHLRYQRTPLLIRSPTCGPFRGS